MLQLAELPFKWFIRSDDHALITCMMVIQNLLGRNTLCTIAILSLLTRISTLVTQSTAHKNKVHPLSRLRKVKISVSFQLIFC